METNEGREFRNRILAGLPPHELAPIADRLEPVTLERRRLLYDPERPISHVHFVEHGIASILSVMSDGSGVETATIGAEGMIGMPLFHGLDRTEEQAMIQVPGNGYRLEAGAFVEWLGRAPELRRMLHRFAAYQFTFAAQNSGCNRKHVVSQRCARWLLIVHDRMGEGEFLLTHDFISQMLGIRRASVSDTLAALQRRGIIRTTRSRIAIVDRAALEGEACECYRIITAAEQRMLHGVGVSSPLRGIDVSRGGVSTIGDGTPMGDEPH
jgi:CRP-like cAMP-binding protein